LEIAGHCQLSSRDAFEEKPGLLYNIISFRLIKSKKLGKEHTETITDTDSHNKKPDVKGKQMSSYECMNDLFYKCGHTL